MTRMQPRSRSEGAATPAAPDGARSVEHSQRHAKGKRLGDPGPWICYSATARRTIEIAQAIVVTLVLAPALLQAAPKGPKLAQKRCVRITQGSSVTVALKRPSRPPSVIVAYASWDGDGTASLNDTAGNAYESAIGPTRSA